MNSQTDCTYDAWLNGGFMKKNTRKIDENYKNHEQ